MMLCTRLLQRCGVTVQAGFASTAIVAPVDWKSMHLPANTIKDIPTATETSLGGASFPGDLRSSSGFGKGDGLTSHTSKWMQVRACFMAPSTCISQPPGCPQGNGKTPLQYIKEVPAIKVEGPVVASYGSDDPALGCPVSKECMQRTPHAWCMHATQNVCEVVGE